MSFSCAKVTIDGTKLDPVHGETLRLCSIGSRASCESNGQTGITFDEKKHL